jgi:hypothetical protein
MSGTVTSGATATETVVRMKEIPFSGWLAVVACCAVGGCAAGSVNTQGKAVAPIGSWKGSVVILDLRSDGHVSYKDPGVAEFTGKWEWISTGQDKGNLVLTSSAAGSANPLRLSITWLDKNALQYCDADEHCDRLSRALAAAPTSRSSATTNPDLQATSAPRGPSAEPSP